MKEIMTLHKPQGWNIFRFDHLFDERKENVSDKDFQPLSVTMSGVVLQLETVAKTDHGDNRKLVRVGDYVINSRSDRKGSGGISGYDGSVSLISIVLQPKGIFPRFAHHLLRSQVFQEEFYRWGHGIVNDLWTTRFVDTKNIYCFLPNLAMQRSIAAFLDRETSRIDDLIAKKQRQIELLQEKRSALISHVVTKGLDPNVKMKDSGVEWLGEIPEGWEIHRLKYCTHLVNQKAEVNESDLPYTGLENIESWTGKRTAMNNNVSSDGQASVHKVGDVLFGKLRPYLAKVYVAEENGICSGEFLVLRSRTILREFLRDYLLNPDFISTVDSSTYGAKMPRANWDFIGSLPTLTPPFPEQRSIAAFLDRETARIDDLIAKVNNSVDLLREYRTALISAAVTGKIDVREEVA